MNARISELAVGMVLAERMAQDEKWGDQAHHPDMTWLTILVEEVGEMAQVILHANFNGKHGTWDNAIEEATQVAAVSMAWLEALLIRRDRGDDL